MGERSPDTISVVIPTFNRAHCLREAIDSVLLQQYAPIELIVVDDGSTDDTPALLAAYGSRLTVIRQANSGVSAARNAGIRAASGNLIAFLDSDDRWLPEKAACQAVFFQRHPEAMICQTEEIWIRNGIRVNPRRVHRKPSGWIFIPSLALCLVSPSAVMMRRELFDAIGWFDESLPACEDYDLWLRTSLHYPIHCIDRPLIVKRGGHGDQLSAMPGLDRFRIQAIVNILDRERLSADQHRAAVDTLRKKCAIYAGGCRKRGRIRDARRYEAIAAQYTKAAADAPGDPGPNND